MDFSSSAPFSIIELLWPAATIAVAGFFICLWGTRSLFWSTFIALAKSGIFFVYYAFLFDGTFTFLDDWNYFNKGQILLSQGVSFVNMLTHLPELNVQANGQHFIYYLYNADAFRIFGPEYYAPVALNVLLTFFSAGLMASVARVGLNLPHRLADWLFVFYVLHPDVVVWSTIMNGKDTLVATGTAMALFAFSQAELGRYKRAVLLVVFVGCMLLFLRFYVPLILLVALMAALISSVSGRRSPLLWLLTGLGFVGVFFVIGGVAGLGDALARLEEKYVNPLFGAVRFLLTPIPFNTMREYAFLDYPQVFHWAFMPFLGYGIFQVWKRATLTSRSVVIYFLMMLLLYGMFEELQGPRHRVQLHGAVILFQFYGILSFLRKVLLARDKQYSQTPEGTCYDSRGGS